MAFLVAVPKSRVSARWSAEQGTTLPPCAKRSIPEAASVSGVRLNHKRFCVDEVISLRDSQYDPWKALADGLGQVLSLK